MNTKDIIQKSGAHYTRPDGINKIPEAKKRQNRMILCSMDILNNAASLKFSNDWRKIKDTQRVIKRQYKRLMSDADKTLQP